MDGVIEMEIGEILKEARETKGLSLDDIQELTKIQKRYLVAIEQNDFHVLPGRFYARAFIKEYALAVDLDPNEVLQDFDEEKIELENEEIVQYSRLERSRRPKVAKSSSIFSMLPSIIVIILVIGIIFVAWTLYQRTTLNNDVEVENPTETDEIIRNVEEPESEEPIGSNDENEGDEDESEQEDGEELDEESDENFSVVEVGSGNSPTSTLAFHHSGDSVTVSLDANSETYVELRGDSGTTYYVGTLQPDSPVEEFDISDEERVYFNVGNASGLSIALNDVELEYPVNPQEIVHQKLWIELEKQ